MRPKNIWGSDLKENFFRKKFCLEKVPARAYARIYVDTGYELFINERFVASVDEWCNTRDYEVSKFMTAGENIVAVHALNHAGHRGFAFELVADGKSVLVSDELWQSMPKERWGWYLKDFDASQMQNAVALNLSCAGEPQWHTLPGSEPDRIIPTLDCSQFFGGNIPKTCASPYWNSKKEKYKYSENVLEMLGDDYKKYINTPTLPSVCTDYNIMCANGTDSSEPIKIENTQRYTGPSFVVDFKGEVCGYFRMKLSSQGSLSFRLYYGETINEALSEPPRDVCQNRMLKEEFRLFEGKTEFESRMRVAFRYVRVEFFDCDAKVVAEDFSVRTRLYPVNKRGYFSCSDDALNKVWEMGEKTLHLCMQEYYLDAPKRDRFLWTGDARLESLINYHTFADTALFEFCWNELSRVQYENGAVPSAYGEGNSVLLDYVAWYVIAFYDYLMYVGNKEYVTEHKENIFRATDYLSSLCGENGLISVPKNPLGRLWMVELNEFVGEDPYLNELYKRCLETATIVGDLATDDEAKDKYLSLLKNIEKPLEKLLSDNNLIKTFDESGHTQIQYELAECELLSGNITAMVDRIKKYWCSMISSGSDCLHECTLVTGKHTRIDSTDEPNPAYSYCHGWTAAANILLPMGIGGIVPISPGFKKVKICPVFDVLESFKCAVPTPFGEIALKYEGGILCYSIPYGIEAELVIHGKKTAICADGVMSV